MWVNTQSEVAGNHIADRNFWQVFMAGGAPAMSGYYVVEGIRG